MQQPVLQHQSLNLPRQQKKNQPQLQKKEAHKLLDTLKSEAVWLDRAVPHSDLLVKISFLCSLEIVDNPK